MGPPVTGSPFSAERVSERVQVASDGTRFTSTDRQETVYRDSQGRMRTERPAIIGSGPQPAGVPLIVEIQDPVTRSGYMFDTQNKVAHRVALEIPETRRPARAIPPPAAGGDSSSRADTTQEDLGQRVIEGVPAEGHRIVHTWPAGSMGNDRAFQTTSETWFSPDLGETVLTKRTDPRSGDEITRLIHISRTEPSPGMFMPPAGYSVVDETGPFRIQWTAARQ